MLKRHLSILVIASLLMINTLSAQSEITQDQVKEYIITQASNLDVSQDDLYDLKYIQTATLNGGVGQVHYYNQAIGDIIISNATINVIQTADDQLSVSGSRLISDIDQKLDRAKYTLTPEEAVSLTGKRLGHALKVNAIAVTDTEDGSLLADNVPFVSQPIKMNKSYRYAEGKISPVWTLEVDLKESSDYLQVSVHGSTGELMNIHNYTVYCNHNHRKGESCAGHHAEANSDNEAKTGSATAAALLMGDGSTYQVYPWPAESPIHGPHTVVTEPADDIASPFGWHDTNGAEGAEYTITRGNNVHAYQDREQNNSSLNDEPDGGEELAFIYDHMREAEPIFSEDAAITNLFYSVNKMHDYFYYFGFNEENGNFQANNYGNGGLAGDHVNAEAFDGSGTNNANFSTPPDSGNGRMQMFLWDQGGDNLFSVESPASIGGFIPVGLAADDPLWAFDYAESPINGKLVLATDGNLQGGTQLCGPVDNVSEITGNVAVVDRGECFFSEKALNAQNGGAIACVICNVEGVNGGTGEELLNMAAGEIPEPVTIPTVFMGKSDCDRLRVVMAGGDDVIINIEEIESTGPDQFDASFDNAIVAHEYGHGISTRLTGGSGNSGCLFNVDTDGDGEPDAGEQMGEGWSDFYALVIGTDADNAGGDIRGMSPYINGEDVNGGGIRVFPYSTDMSINPQTYDDIANASVPHGVGAVWNAMIWDMYWAFVDLYGFDEDVTNTESGNFRAVKLVTDAMMIQPCRPGFVDGRDAIFEADNMNYGGIHNCMIWEVFARRGLGYLADQGDSMDHLDGFENFDPLPTCIKELKITKSATTVIKPGEEIAVEIYYANHTEGMADGVVITDEVPTGMTYQSSTASVEPTVSGNMISWDFGDVETLREESFIVTYTTDQNIASKRTFYDPIRDAGDWVVGFLEGFNVFNVVTIFPNSGQRSWWVESVANASDQTLDSPPFMVTGDFPVLRFYHAYETQLRADGGFVMVSTDGGLTFQFVDDKFIHNGYETILQFGTFAIPSLQAFSGNSNGYKDSYIDLTEFAGQEIVVRFRWGSDDDTSPAVQPGTTFIPGWYIDDFELLDLKLYESQACVNSTSVEGQCSVVRTTIVDTGLQLSNTSDLDLSGTHMQVFPNPSGGTFNLQINDASEAIDYSVALYTLQGRLMSQAQVQKGSNQHNYSIDASDLSSGMYLIQVTSENGVLSKKVILNK